MAPFWTGGTSVCGVAVATPRRPTRFADIEPREIGMVKKPKSRGRPIFVPTRDQRNRVEELVAADQPELIIAAEIGISIPTLKKHFPDELEHGKAYVRKRAMSELFKQGLKNGSIPALKAIVALTTETKAPNAPKKPEGEAPAMRVGKKIAQKLEAEAANKGLYATPEPPKQVKSTLQ